jgi:hypothetical protein
MYENKKSIKLVVGSQLLFPVAVLSIGGLLYAVRLMLMLHKRLNPMQ